MFKDYCKILDKYELDTAEVSDGSIEISHEEKCKYIKDLNKKVTVLSEVGSRMLTNLYRHTNGLSSCKKKLKQALGKLLQKLVKEEMLELQRYREVRSDLIEEILTKILKKNLMGSTSKITTSMVYQAHGSNVNLEILLLMKLFL